MEIKNENYGVTLVINYIMELTNLRDETNILMELNHFGASQKEDSRDVMESRKPTFITS